MARINKFVMGMSSFVEKNYRTEILLNYMDISRLMVYAKQIEEFEIRDIRQEGKRPRFDESSQPKPKKGTITKCLPWGTRIALRKKILKEVTILLRGLGVLLVESNTL